MTEKEDGILHTFVLEFAEALATEYNFMVNVSQGFANNRPDAVERHMKELFTVVNLTVSTTPFINGLVSVITDQVGQLMQNRNNLQTEKKMSEMTKHSPEERTMLFNQIALEVMYRYGTCIYFYSTQLGPENSRLLLSRLARTGAIRIVYHALKLGIGFENCEKLVKGMDSND